MTNIHFKLLIVFSLFFVSNSFAQNSDATLIQEDVKFIASNLINFNQTKLSWQNKSINIDSLKWKKDRALYLLDSIVNLPIFKVKISEGHYTHTQGLSNEEIFEKFVSPKYKNIREHLILVIDTSWTWNVKYQRGKHPSIGYDNRAGDSTVHTVQVQLVKFLTPEDYAEHIAHEYCHMIGFSHPKPGKWRAVPYGIQRIIGKLLQEKIAQNDDK